MKRILVILLACMVMIGQMGVCAYAASDSTEKEEVVYVNLAGNGKVDSIQVVNIFTEKSRIVDYGDYSSVKNLTTADKIDRKDDVIRIDTDAEKLYYQGNLPGREIPWDISIKYILDGKTVSFDELSGKSGKFEMRVNIKENKGFDESFWKGYALQATLNLDSENFRNISADGATIANEGSDKKLTYIILPGKEKTIDISADASDIAMEGMSINAIKLNIDMDFDTTELKGKIDTLKEKVDELNLGSEQLDRKAEALRKGAENLNTGSGDLEKGIKRLNKGAEKLTDGAMTMEDAFNEAETEALKLQKGSEDFLDGIGKLRAQVEQIKVDTDNIKTLISTSSDIKTGIGNIETNLELLEQSIETYEANMDSYLKNAGIEGTKDLSDRNKKAAEAIQDRYPDVANLLMIDAGYVESSSGTVSNVDEAVGDLADGAAYLAETYVLFDENISLLAKSINNVASNMEAMKEVLASFEKNYKKLNKGIHKYAEGMDQMKQGFDDLYDGIIDVSKGVDSLIDGTSIMTDGTMKLYEGAVAFAKGTEKMSDGTGLFKKETDGINSGEVDKVVDEKTGKRQPVKSFVSEKNKKVTSVMFVMKTPAIEKKNDEKKEEKPAEKKSFFQKFLDLFKKKDK